MHVYTNYCCWDVNKNYDKYLKNKSPSPALKYDVFDVCLKMVVRDFGHQT